MSALGLSASGVGVGTAIASISPGGRTVHAIVGSDHGRDCQPGPLPCAPAPLRTRDAVTFLVVLWSDEYDGSLPKPSGAVGFYDGDTLLGTSVVRDASASLTTSSLAVGSHTVYGRYAGDGLYNAASTEGLVVRVATASEPIGTPVPPARVLPATAPAIPPARVLGETLSAAEGPVRRASHRAGTTPQPAMPVALVALVAAVMGIYVRSRHDRPARPSCQRSSTFEVVERGEWGNAGRSSSGNSPTGRQRSVRGNGGPSQ